MMKHSRFTFWRVVLSVAAVGILFFISWAVFRVGQFYESQDALSGAISRGDQLAVRERREDLKYFYELNKSLRPLGLDSLADKYLFQNFRYYEASYDFLVGNHERVLEQLKDDDSFWARFIRANATWRLAQAIMEKAMQAEKESEKMSNGIKALELAASTKDDYCEAVKLDPNSTLPPKWNCDLVSDPKAMANALLPKSAKIKIVIGLGGSKKKGDGKDEGEGPKGAGPKDLKLSVPSQPGKSRPGGYRPG